MSGLCFIPAWERQRIAAGPLVSGEAGRTVAPAACGAGPAPAAAATCLSSSSVSAHRVQRHTDGNSSGARITGKSIGEGSQANRQHPSV